MVKTTDYKVRYNVKSMVNDWYKKIWTLDIQDQSWVEDTKHQIDFLIEKLNLNGSEKIFGEETTALRNAGR